MLSDKAKFGNAIGRKGEQNLKRSRSIINIVFNIQFTFIYIYKSGLENFLQDADSIFTDSRKM